MFSEAKVDAFTGQVTLRGQFPNPKRELLPGMYVRVKIEQGIDTDSIAVPQQAVQRNGGGGSEVFVVKDDGHVATQVVRMGQIQDGQWFVTEGLKGGEKSSSRASRSLHRETKSSRCRGRWPKRPITRRPAISRA